MKDFKAYTQATGYQQMGLMIWYGKEGWKRGNYTWDKMPFPQTELHPVSGVEWQEAVDFCEWLTQKERAEGKLKVSQEYRLPTDAEWTEAAGNERFPWGTQWPPPLGAGNFGGEEVLQDGNWFESKDVIVGYHDPYPRSSPVGSFTPTSNGIYDLAGNNWEWCEDWYDDSHHEKIMRGASWHSANPLNFECRFRSHNFPRDHVENNGFRCVLADISTRLKVAAGRPMEIFCTNSLGMEFVAVTDAKVLFSIWETRVADFAAFVKETGYDATAGVRSFSKTNQWGAVGESWKNPGFKQTKDHPVVGVSWLDAVAFCEWLTAREHKTGALDAGQRYRLPTEAEWNVAVGTDIYPWGNTSSPPQRSGNYAGVEVVGDGNWPTGLEVLWDYKDFYSRTAPVGAFYPNRLGIYDLGGNAREWCLDDAAGGVNVKITMGGAWDSNRLDACLSHKPLPLPMTTRNTTTGFRCVLEGASIAGPQ